MKTWELDSFGLERLKVAEKPDQFVPDLITRYPR